MTAAAWHTDKGYRWAELPPPSGAATGFVRMPADTTGIRFFNALDELAGAANRVLYNGAGVAAGDVDADGLTDLFFCNLSGTNALYRNLGGWRFEEVTQPSGLADRLPESRGAVFADINADGSLDLLVSVNGRGVRCFVNDGRGRFTDATAAAGTESRLGSTTLAMADIDGNGTPDLYVANYRTDDIRDRGRVNLSMVNGRPILRGSETNRFQIIQGKLEENGQPDQLYLNDGHGRFTPVSWTGGAFLDERGEPLKEAPLDWGLSAAFHDVNGDGAPDLYVCNDFWTPDRLWINDGKGRFRAVDPFALRKMPASSMGVDFADVDRDGDVDFFVVDMLSRDPRARKRQLMAQMPAPSPVGLVGDRPQVARNALYLNRGDGTFAETAFQAGVEASDWSWSPVFSDVDLDGNPDLLIAAGHFRDVQDFDAERVIQSRQRKWDGFPTDAARQKAFTQELMEHHRLYPLLRVPVVAFRNEGGARFKEVTGDWGLDLPGIHQGMALADLDGDGGLDVVVNSLNDPALVLRHQSPAARVVVRLKGRAPNTQALGARVTLRGGAVPEQSVEWVVGGRYLSGSDPSASFATGSVRDGMTLEIRWRGGAVSRIADVRSQRVYEVDEGAVEGAPGPADPSGGSGRPGLGFEDVSARLGHVHPEQAYDDFARQPLLPWKLSQMGPGVAWFDLNGDTQDDLIIGAGRGGSVSVFESDGQGGFRAASRGAAPGVAGVPDDTSGMAGWVDGKGRRGLVIARTGYEATLREAAVFRGVTENPSSELRVGAEMTGGSAVALGHPTSDGRPWLFIGGGVVPGRYPLGAASKLYRSGPDGWALEARQSQLLENIGIVNGAVWSDLDADGDAELVLACEWGPLRVFDWRGGRLVDRTEALGLARFTGWWRGVTAGDLNGDGRMDLIASNWGWNSPYRASGEQPLTVVFGEWAQPGVMEVLETEYAGSSLIPRLALGSLLPSMPFLMERFPDHRSYSEADLNAVLGDRQVLSRRVSVTTLASAVFLNAGSGFRAIEMPAEAQRAPGYGVTIADFDGDGHEDVFLAQNLFQVRREAGRLDGGVGCMLLGDGTGNLRAASSRDSGIHVDGEQRGAAVADFDGDGRTDLVVTQNGAATRLYRNRAARPGLRVRVLGPAENPFAYGAVVRLRHGEELGPAREVHGGSGYWSQDSGVLVLGGERAPTAVWVRWPGGSETTVPVPSGAREVTVRPSEANR